MKKYTRPSLDSAREHYQGYKADVYEDRRARKVKWHLENKCLESMLERVRGRVLDVPVGTGRFLQLYKNLGLEAVGIDYNPAMLDQARAKYPDAVLSQGDITKLPDLNEAFDAVVCVRLLHLVAPDEVPLVMKELLRVAKNHVIVTIHLDTVARVQGRSQVHTDATLACVPAPWSLYRPRLLMLEKGMPYYMLHYVR